MCHPENAEPIKWTVARLVRKCPHLENIILHGLDMCYGALSYVCKHLPETMKGIDMARNPKVNDANVRELMTRCPNLRFLDLSETGVTVLILADLPAAWGHSMINLSLPNTVARRIKDYYNTNNNAIAQVVNHIRNMTALYYLRMGNWRASTAAESHRSFNGRMSFQYTEDLRTIYVLKELFQELEIHLSPYAEEDEGFYNKTGFPRPNPNFPPPLDPHYYFRRWMRGGENFIIEDTC